MGAAVTLSDDLGRLTRLLEGYAASGQVQPAGATELATPGGPVDALVSTFGLSPFERDVLLLCAGVELDAACAAVVAQLRGAAVGIAAAPTFGIALAALPDAHWSALAPVGPLRYWRLIELEPGASLVSSALRIDERILHFLAGVQYVDERLAGAVTIVDEAASLAPAHRTVAERMAACWLSLDDSDEAAPILQLCGADLSVNRDIAAHACAMAGSTLALVHARNLPAAAPDLNSWQRLWEREAILVPGVLMIIADLADDADAVVARNLESFAERSAAPLILSTTRRRSLPERTVLSFEVSKPSPTEQQLLWRQALGRAADAADPALDALVYQFDLKAAAIRAAAVDALGTLATSETAAETPGRLGAALWNSSRNQARPNLEDIVQRIEPAATWRDLILPPAQQATLWTIADQIRLRPTVHGDWGFSAASERGFGIAALFAGPSGTGKTLAAEVLANELRLDLYRIDISAVVSKFIGETEKNLRRAFDAAEAGGAILLFDEADALFGKRSDVKDSHDRYANLEVSYLLQRIESYRGLAILTTNLKDSVDQAFLRRLRFIVSFPYPSAGERQRIWERAFPPGVPQHGLDYARLGQLNVTGGSIHNIALHASFLAAKADDRVTMAHVRDAARAEYAKIEKAITEQELRGWE